MRYYLLTVLLISTVIRTSAQSISSLPAGRYSTKVQTAQNGWDHGDILLLDADHYQLTSNNETGTYKFSVAAQRLFFTSGPLKTAFTKVEAAGSKIVIVFPVAENSTLGLKAEVMASKQ